MYAQIAAAFRKNFFPGLVLWLFGISLIGLYFYAAPIQAVLDRIASLKQTYSFLFSAVSMGIFGGFIPALVASAMGRIPRYRRHKDTAFFTLFWAYKGIEIDILYRVQAALFGSGSDFLTLTFKTLVDQFLYMPIIATVPLLALYRWKDLDYSLPRVRQDLGARAFWRQLPVVIVSCWAVWIPAVYMIYWFPSALQLAIANLVECFWALMLIVLTGTDED